MAFIKRRTAGNQMNSATHTDAGLVHAMRLVWTIIGIGIVVVSIGFVVGRVSTALWTVVAAGIVVFILRRPVRWLADKGVPRAASAALLLVAVVAIIVGVAISFVPLIVDQLTSLFNALPRYLSEAQTWWDSFVADNPDLAANTYAQSWITSTLDSLMHTISSLQATVVSGVYQAGVSLANILMYGIMAFLIAFWILLDYDRMTNEVHILAGRTAEWYLILFSTIFSRVLGGYLRGTIITAILIAVVSGVGYMIAGLPFALVLGLFMGIFSIVPYLGPVIAAVVICVLALFSGPFAFVISLIVSIVVPWMISSFVSPKIMSSTVNLHPGIIMVAIIAGGALGGILGMIFAIPVAAAAKCLLVYFFEGATGRQLVGSDGAVFSGSPTDVIDPVADATDNFLTAEKLYAMVEAVEGDIHKVELDEEEPRRSLSYALAHPMEDRMVTQSTTAHADTASETVPDETVSDETVPDVKNTGDSS